MPSTGNAAWDVVVAFVGLIASAVGIAVVFKGGLRVNKDADKARDSPLPPTWAEMWTEMRRLRGEVDELRQDHADLNGRMGVVEQDRDALGDALRPIVAWDDAGRPDPPGFPGVASQARRALDRLHNT